MVSTTDVLEEKPEYIDKAKTVLNEIGAIKISARGDYYEGIEDLSPELYARATKYAKEKYGEDLDFQEFHDAIKEVMSESGIETEDKHFEKYWD